MIRSQDDIQAGLLALAALDARLLPVIAAAGAVPLRRGAGGLRGLVFTVVGQQVSRASAEAIFRRLSACVDLDDPHAIRLAGDDALRGAGLSGAKMRALRAIAGAATVGTLDLDRVAGAKAGEAIAELVAVPGIGPWTAECHLLFSIGHPDVFPAGDLALQVAVAHAFACSARLSEKALRATAEGWAPHRSVAARLFWAYYAVLVRRDGVPA